MDSKRATDADIFDSIVSQHQDRLFRFAFMRVGVRETAEDMVQDVFIRLFRAMSEGKKILNPESFLLRSINNACIDRYRRKRPSSVIIDEIEDIPEEADSDIDEEFRRISRLLAGLPFDQAETLRLKCYDGLTFRQIAELQEIPEATVKSRYRYAIRSIRDNLTKES